MRIAVVGIGCRYPGAKSAQELFENILSGRRFFREIPQERWSVEDYYHEDRKNPDTTYCKLAAVIEDFQFNPAEFKIPRSTYHATDQAQWLALQTSKEALADANLAAIPHERTAVIIGNTLTGEVSRASLLRFRWPYVKRVIGEILDGFKVEGALKELLMEKIEARYKHPFPPVNEDNLAGGLSNTIAGRISNFFDFQGGAFTTDGACSSSLLAINQACMALQRGDIDVALTGGVDISLDPFEIVGFAKVGALSPEDIRVYDQNSSGFLPGEGCGIVVLKRLEDAQRDNDRIYAVVNGVGISSDGKGGITAPSVSGQSLAVDRAYKAAGYSFAEVELIEGHGTGTPVGDGVELNTFKAAKQRHGASPEHRCGIGSIKSNIGHTKAAAGVAGFIKAVMSTYYGILPPTKNIRKPNEIFLESQHIYPLLSGKRWSSNGLRRAAVSSAGFGGINTHVTLSSVDEALRGPEEETRYFESLLHSYQDSEVFLIGAGSIVELKENIDLLLTAAPRVCHAELGDLANYCVKHFTKDKIRLGIVADSAEALAESLFLASAYLATKSRGADIDYINTEKRIFIQSALKTPRVGFLFPGQGSQRLNMGAWLRNKDRTVTEFWEKCDAFLAPLMDGSLIEKVIKDTDSADTGILQEWTAALNDTRIAQPAIIVASMAATNYLRELGIYPAITIGHSLGEYAALWSAGALDTETALTLVAARGSAMAKAASVKGKMLSINAPAEKVSEILAEIVGYATISNYNSPTQTVISGEESAIDAARELCAHRGIGAMPIPVSNAFHSKFMANAHEEMAEHLRDRQYGNLDCLVISTMTGDFVDARKDLSELLRAQITEPVRFMQAINQAVKEDCDLLIEVGPGSILTNLSRQIIRDRGTLAFSADVNPYGQHSHDFNTLIAYLYAAGVPLDLARLGNGRFFREIKLPYAPNFIASPCEAPVPQLELEMERYLNISSEAPAGVRPVEQPASRYEEVHAHIEEPVAGEVSEKSILKMLQNYVTREFGYSAEMVAPGARLQENLGLDSLKSVEVAFEAMGQLGVRADVTSLGDVSLEVLAAFLYKLVSKKEGDEGGGAGTDITVPLPDWVNAFFVTPRTAALDRSAYASLGKRVLLAGTTDTPLLTVLENELIQLGIEPVVSSGEGKLPQGNYDGCIFVSASECDESVFDIDADSIESRLYAKPRHLLTSAQALLAGDGFRQGDRRFFAIVTQQGGWFHAHCEQALPNIDAMAGTGFVKSLHLETRIDTFALDFHPGIDMQRQAELVINEIMFGKGHVDAGYASDDERRIPEYKLSQTACLPAHANTLNTDDVLLVTGGGKGITAETVLALGKRFGVKLALVGSSALPAADSAEARASELWRNLERFRDAGIEHKYYQCDVLDAAEVHALVGKVKADMGGVSGILHAAGVNTLHKIEKTDWQDFSRVLRPKMQGLLNLLSAVKGENLKTVIAFSSIIAHSGMAGNADYSYANQWMNLVLRRFKTEHPQVNVQSYNYSVWSEVGMGARMGSVDVLGTLGITAIPAEAGVRKFIQMIDKDWPDIDMVVTSRVGALDTIAFADESGGPGSRMKARFLERVLSYHPEVELVSEVFLTPSMDRYLEEHNYEGSLLFPAVMGIEAMVECATACLGESLQAGNPVLENLSFSRAIVVPPQGRSIRIYAQAGGQAFNGERRVSVFIRSSVTDYEVDYFSADCVWSRQQQQLAGEAIGEIMALPLDPMRDLYGKILFQGAMFQNIENYLMLSSKQCLVRIKVPDNEQVFSAASEFRQVFGSGEVRDAFLHAVQLCVPDYRILPVSIEKVVFIRHDGPVLFLRAIERFRTENEFMYDLKVYNQAGECVEVIEGFRCRIMGDYKDAENLSVIYDAHSRSIRTHALPIESI